MNITHNTIRDFVINNLPSKLTYLKIDGDKLYVHGWIPFYTYSFSQLPNNLVFTNNCVLDGSQITTLPNDIILLKSLHIKSTNIKMVDVDVGGCLDIRDTVPDLVLKSGIYIGDQIWSTDHPKSPSPLEQYAYLDGIHVYGYYFKTGLLS